MTRRVRLIGIGCGHPDQLTIEAVEALKASAFALVTVKRDDDPLAAARHAIIERHAPGLRVIEVLDPERDRSASSTSTAAGYEGVVTDWHDARAEAWEMALEAGWVGPSGSTSGDIALLVWGDPAFYDSTIRVVERVLARGELRFEWDVLPGISAVQLLAARHRIVLHEVGQPILVTTARRLRAAIIDGAENIVVMLGASLDLEGLDDWQIWWGANLGTSDERLVAGRVADVLPTLQAARDEARSTSGWVMDVYLLRRPRAVT